MSVQKELMKNSMKEYLEYGMLPDKDEAEDIRRYNKMVEVFGSEEKVSQIVSHMRLFHNFINVMKIYGKDSQEVKDTLDTIRLVMDDDAIEIATDVALFLSQKKQKQ